MRAAVCRHLGGPEQLCLEELPRPEIAPGRVRVAMRAAGANFPDLLMVAGGYQLRPELPFTPGLEGAGLVTERGPGVKGVDVGARVIVRMRPGTYTEEVVVPPGSLIPLSDSIDFADGASLTVAHRTAYHALVDRARLQPGETLLVHGAGGGVGLAAVELGAVFGARVIAVAGGPEKLAVARTKGAAETIDHRETDFREAVLTLTDGDGADVIYDPVGGDVFDQSLRCIAWGGRLLVVGFADGRIPTIPMNYPLLKGASVLGLRAGEHGRRHPESDARNVAAIMALAAEGRIAPHISHRVPLARAADALRLLDERRVIGRAVVEISHGGA